MNARRNQSLRTVRRTHRNAALIAGTLGIAALNGCGNGSVPSEAEVNDASQRVNACVAAASQARTGLELMATVRVVQAGQDLDAFVVQAALDVHNAHSCVTATTSRDENGATLKLSYPDSGCSLNGHPITGHADFHFVAANDCADVSADFRGVRVDDQPVQTRAGYSVCASTQRFWLVADGSFADANATRFHVDGNLAEHSGFPVFGDTELALDANADVGGANGMDRVVITNLQYTVGEYLPHDGTIHIETASGHSVNAEFGNSTWRLGTADVSIDQGADVQIPIVH